MILDTEIPSDTQSTDRFQYRVQVQHDLSFETPIEPKEVRPLLRFLEKLQNPGKKSRAVGKKASKKGRKRTS